MGSNLHRSGVGEGAVRFWRPTAFERAEKSLFVTIDYSSDQNYPTRFGSAAPLSDMAGFEKNREYLEKCMAHLIKCNRIESREIGASHKSSETFREERSRSETS